MLLESLTIAAGTDAWLPSMFGHSSVGGGGGGGGVTQLPFASLIIPTGTEGWFPSMLGHTTVGGGVHDPVPPFRALVSRPWAL